MQMAAGASWITVNNIQLNPATAACLMAHREPSPKTQNMLQFRFPHLEINVLKNNNHGFDA